MKPLLADPGSLRAQILRRILPPLLLMLAVAAAGGYSIIRRYGVMAYDQQMADSALALSRYVSDGGKDAMGKPVIKVAISPEVEQALRTDRHDSVFWAVRDGEGNTVAGDPDLPQVPDDMQTEEGGGYFIGMAHGEQIRVGVFPYRVNGVTATVIVAETRNKRRQLAWDIALGILIPEMLLAAGVAGVLWYGVASALSPLEKLRRDLQARSHTDLRPLDEMPVPLEVRPLVEEINNLLLRLAQGAASQQRFIANAAHQLRTPLAGLKTQLELTLADTDHAARQARLEQCRGATERTARLVNQLLALSAAEHGGQGQRPWGATNLAEVLRARADDWVRRSIEKNLDFGLELSKATVDGDPLLLGEMAANLVDNALSYTPEGGRVTLRCGLEGGAPYLSVTDNGPGIRADARGRVMERFFRLPGTQGIGSGLGLAIVGEIAGRHGAAMAILDAPEEEHGTLVMVRFPAPGGSVAAA
ncbi:MAG: sensor histidine kinase N-terminal domain-containing protein [Rhodocyclaceae bacterium]|nr:sensor histidine kinase N-terminal domain-containing protein [Rhodocyclaceae bacterium]